MCKRYYSIVHYSFDAVDSPTEDGLLSASFAPDTTIPTNYNFPLIMPLFGMIARS